MKKGIIDALKTRTQRRIECINGTAKITNNVPWNVGVKRFAVEAIVLTYKNLLEH